VVPSGDYWLSFVAFDGMDYSPPAHRFVRIDRPIDSLMLHGFSPEGDVKMIVGDLAPFSIYVTERLSRPISYAWRLDGDTAASGSPQYAFEALQAGEHVLAVEVSSGLASLQHVWNISARALIAPSILPVSPDRSLTLMKRVMQDFAVSITNPDSVPYEILWLNDGVLLSRVRDASCRVSYDRSGAHNVSALLRWGNGEAGVSWAVTVLNSPPRLVSWSPNATVTILEDTTIDLSVTVQDDDGDQLSFQWEGAGLDADADGDSTLNLTCAYTPGVNRTVSVIASDGEDRVSMTWSVVSPPKVVPPPTVPHSTGPNVTWLFIALILVVATAVTVGYYLGTRRRG